MSVSDVARAFGLGTPASGLTFAARGAMGEVFRLATDRGTFAVKRLLWGPTGGEEANAAFQFAAAAAGVPLARPILTTNGDVLKRLADGWWRVYEWVEGAPVPFRTVTPHDIAVAVANSVGRLHALEYAPGADVDDWFRGATDDAVDRAVAAAGSAGVDLGAARNGLLGLAAVSRLVPNFATITGHNDVERQNVLVGTDRMPVLIDWDNAGPMYAPCEFASVLLNFGSKEGDEPEAATIAAMTGAYRDAGGVFEPNGVEVFAPWCSAWVNYRVNCCEHLADASVDAALLEFERPAVDDLVRYPLTVAKLERILELVPQEVAR